MGFDPVTAAYKGSAAYVRAVPLPVASLTARALSRAAAAISRERRMLVARHLRRAIGPELSGRDLDRAVDATFDSYARYWVESFRLPGTTFETLDAAITVDGFEHITDALDDGQGVILALPHLGGWEWCGVWLSLGGHAPVTVVVEAIEPPSLFEFFASFRREFGLNIVPLDKDAGGAVLRALKDNHIVCLLCDRDIVGDGIDVDFFGERTTLPAGPATLALRTGAPLLPTAVFHEGDAHRAVVHPALAAEREGTFRNDVTRVTETIARELENFIRIAPLQWHLQQPNWPSDYDALEAMGKPHPRPEFGPSSAAAAAARAAAAPDAVDEVP